MPFLCSVSDVYITVSFNSLPLPCTLKLPFRRTHYQLTLLLSISTSDRNPITVVSGYSFYTSEKERWLSELTKCSEHTRGTPGSARQSLSVSPLCIGTADNRNTFQRWVHSVCFIVKKAFDNSAGLSRGGNA